MARRAPGFSVVVILVLALGIGANSAMFTFVNALLFRPLSGRASELVGLYSHDPTQPNSYRSFSYPNFADIRDRNDVFDEVIAYTFSLAGRPAGDVMQRTFVEVVSSNFFSAIGVGMAAGRAFLPDEERPGADIPVAVASYAAWEQSGFDPSFIGRTVRINIRDFTIVGVAPKGFSGTTAFISPEVWVPFGVFNSVVNDLFKNNGRGLTDRANRALSVAGRLKRGVTIEHANSRLAVLSADLEGAFPAENRKQVLTVHPLSRVNISSSPQSDTGPAVFSAVLMPLSGAVLLIACLNIANMLLARGTARKKEIAIRLALGGGRARIVRQLLTESLVLAFAGAVGGLLLGWWTTGLLLASLAPIMPMPIVLEARPDLNIVLAATAFAVLSALGFGLAPALKITRPDLVDDLKDLGAARSSRRLFGTRAWLVVAQIAVSLMLITAGGLFVRGALRANVANPGYGYDGLLLASSIRASPDTTAVQARPRLRAALDRIRRLPGVVAAGANVSGAVRRLALSARVARLGQQPSAGREPTYTVVTAGLFQGRRLPPPPGPRLHAQKRFWPRNRAWRSSTSRWRDVSSTPRIHSVSSLGSTARAMRTRTAENDPMTDRRHRPGHSRRSHRAPGDRAPLRAGIAAISSDRFHINVRTTARENEMLSRNPRELQAVDAASRSSNCGHMREFHDRGLVLWVIRTAGPHAA